LVSPLAPPPFPTPKIGNSSNFCETLVVELFTSVARLDIIQLLTGVAYLQGQEVKHADIKSCL
jgi:hypothetical protein